MIAWKMSGLKGIGLLIFTVTTLLTTACTRVVKNPQMVTSEESEKKTAPKIEQSIEESTMSDQTAEKRSEEVVTSKRYRIPYDNDNLKPDTPLEEEVDPRRLKLREMIQSVIGKKGNITIDGKEFTADCSGMVRGVYSSIGMDLLERYREFPEAEGGVDIMYQSYKNQEWKDKNRLPKTGDLIIFNNTYDKNHNNKWDDFLTHIAVVEGIEKGSRTVSLIHSVNSGIRRYRMNLDQPKVYMSGGRKFNDFLRRRPDWDQVRTKYMSGSLFYSYIDILDLSSQKLKTE